MTTKEWKNFALGMRAPIRSVKSRFEARPGDWTLTRGEFERFGERFEAIEVTDLGAVTVWTTIKVWGIREQIQFEKLIYLPRNPPDRGAATIAFRWRDFILNTEGKSIGSVDGRFDIRHGGQIITRDLVEQDGDVIEAIDVSNLGGITIWTTSRVWCVRYEIQHETFIYLPRNPTEEAV